jgi:hypothetical protein
LWLDAVRQALARGMHVLTARAAVTESVTAYISLADLFSRFTTEVLNALPEPQRLAVDRIQLLPPHRKSTAGTTVQMVANPGRVGSSGPQRQGNWPAGARWAADVR